MSWIKLPGDEDSPELARATRLYRKQGRPTPAVIAAMKPNPRLLDAVRRMNNAATFGGSSVGRRTEELVATTVSALNDCFY